MSEKNFQIDDNSNIYLSIDNKNNKKKIINFKLIIKKNNLEKTYIGFDTDFKEDLNVTEEEFLKHCQKNYKFKPIKNEEEISLKIIDIKNNKNSKDVILKEQNSIGNNEENWKEKLTKLKEEYTEKINQIIKDNSGLVKLNEELQKEIDNEKRRNDEIVKIYLENREKYEKAAIRNKDISDLQNKL